VKTFLVALSAFSLILIFPDLNQAWLAWIALIPLLIVSLTSRPAGAFGWGLLAGTASLLGIFSWIYQVPGFRFYHALPLALFYGLFPAVWCAVISWFGKRDSCLLSLFAPALWVTLGFLQNHMGFLSFSWTTLARSQHAHPVLLQIASVTGEYGVTFLIVLANTALALLILRRACQTAVAAGIVIGLCVGWGAYRLNHSPRPPTIRVAVVQPAILLKERKTAESRAAARRRLETLTYQAAQSRPALIVWPETAIRDLKRHPELVAWLKELATETHAALIVGASEFVKFGRGKPVGNGRIRYKLRQYNAAWFFTPSGHTSPPYHKRLLVPFGEYLPLSPPVSWPKWLVPAPIRGLAGKAYRAFPLEDGLLVTPIICWENLFPDFVREAVKDRADMVVHLVNDNWFGPTAAPYQHNMASVLRAVENRLPIIVASNTGPSEIIGPDGRVLARAPGTFRPCVIAAEVPVPKTRTLFTRYGEIFPLLCFLLLIPLLYYRAKKRR